jgi:hypothetical protein
MSFSKMITSLQALVLFMGYHIVVSSTDWVRKEHHALGDESIVSRLFVPKYHQQAHDRFRRILKRQGQYRQQARRNYAIIQCERNHGHLDFGDASAHKCLQRYDSCRSCCFDKRIIAIGSTRTYASVRTNHKRDYPISNSTEHVWTWVRQADRPDFSSLLAFISRHRL